MTIADLKAELKPILRNSGFIMNKKACQVLSKLGFQVEFGRKHYSLLFQGKKKQYRFPVSVTCSDKRAGLNMVSVIARTIKAEEGDLWT